MTLDVAVACLLGVFTWSLMEYVIHRWLGHDPRLRPNPFATEHVRHHAEGNYFAPSWKKACAAAAITPVLAGPAVAIAGWATGLGYVVGFVGMYLGYEVMHRREHTHPGFGPYARWARRHHFHHHFTNHRANFGVTSPIWDWIFGSYRRAGTIRVPAKLQMAWLVDPGTGRVRTAYAEHYELLE